MKRRIAKPLNRGASPGRSAIAFAVGAVGYTQVTRGVAYSSPAPALEPGSAVGAVRWTTSSNLRGMTLNRSTGVISGTSSEGSGTIDHQLIVVATDARGNRVVWQQNWRWVDGQQGG